MASDSSPTRSAVGDGIYAAPHSWTFGGDVWRGFDDHIRRSIPFYDQLHELIVGFASQFVPPEGRVYELGCSTGTLCRKLNQRLNQARICGVDAEAAMIDAARSASPADIVYQQADLRQFQLEPCHYAILCYLLQFLPVAERLPLLRRIYESLELGGAVVVAEKVKRSDPAFEQLCRQVHHDFKRAQGYSEAEITAKDRSLEGILVPLTDTENIEMLSKAGFRSVYPIFHNTSFDAWLAVK